MKNIWKLTFCISLMGLAACGAENALDPVAEVNVDGVDSTEQASVC